MEVIQFFAASKDLQVGRGELYSVLPPDEDAIWQSEMRLNEAAGTRRSTCSDCLIAALH